MGTLKLTDIPLDMHVRRPPVIKVAVFMLHRITSTDVLILIHSVHECYVNAGQEAGREEEREEDSLPF